MEFDDRFASDAPLYPSVFERIRRPVFSGCSETMSRFQFAVNGARYRANNSVIGHTSLLYIINEYKGRWAI